MWLLESDDGEDKQQYRLLLGVEFIVGRKGCNLNLDDRSVSRQHAILIAKIPDTSSTEQQPVLQLKDVSSFGTRINKKKLEKNVLTRVHDADKIIFGSPKSTYKARFSPLVVTSSCLEKSMKADLERTLRVLGGKVVGEWGPSCTHLVMQHLSITVKVICALASQRSVVTINYFKKLIESIKNYDVPCPEESKFLPNVSDSLAVRNISTFQPNIKRKTLFNGKTFIFFSASQMKKMQEAITLSGGQLKQHSEKTDISDQDIIADDIRIMQPPSNATINKEIVSHIQAVLESYGKRMITDAEVGHAVMSCCIQQYCNPDAEPGKPMDPLASQTMRTQTQDVFNSSTQASMSQMLNQSHRNKFTESTSDAKHSSSHREDDSRMKKTSASTEESTIEPVSKKRRHSSVETDLLEDESTQESSSKKQCVFKIPVLDETRHSMKASTSTTLVADTESEKSFIRPKPITVVADSNPEDEESESLFDKPKSSKSDDSITTSKKGLSIFVQDRAGFDGKEPDGKNLDLSTKILVQDTPSTSGVSQIGKKPYLVVGDSEYTEPEMSVSNIETPVQVKKEVMDPEFSTLREPKSQVIKEETQTESIPKNGISKKDTRRQALVDVNIPEGFLTTRLPIKNQVIKVKREEDFEENELPQCCIETVFTNLVAKKSSRPVPNPVIASSGERAPEGFKYYRGKLVRDFKKFKKNALARGFSLPRIIGGSDLVTHVISRSKEIDEWMRQSKEQESQQNEDERRAEELFNWDSRGKQKRSR